jgi:hypothetical protein
MFLYKGIRITAGGVGRRLSGLRWSQSFGEATQTLNNFLGGGGQNGRLTPLYQIGGPRSMQLALKM